MFYLTTHSTHSTHSTGFQRDANTMHLAIQSLNNRAGEILEIWPIAAGGGGGGLCPPPQYLYIYIYIYIYIYKQNNNSALDRIYVVIQCPVDAWLFCDRSPSVTLWYFLLDMLTMLV